MIATIRGTLVQKAPTAAVVDVGGVGYDLHIPLSTYEALGEPGTQITLFTHLHVREDALSLYAFATQQEREVFRLLIAVNGIGPRMAQGILSGIPVSDLRSHIASGNLSALTAIPGVGRKIGERLIIELREKIGRLEPPGTSAAATQDKGSTVRSEALMALLSLGYSRPAAEKAIRAALQESAAGSESVELLLKSALRHAAGQQG